MCGLRRVGRRCIVGIGSGGMVSGGGYNVLWSIGRARSALFGRVATLLSDFSVCMAEVASDMTTLHDKGIDGKVKRGMEDCERDDAKDVEEFDEGHRKERKGGIKECIEPCRQREGEKEKKREVSWFTT
jgi:hypothetical protein